MTMGELMTKTAAFGSQNLLGGPDRLLTRVKAGAAGGQRRTAKLRRSFVVLAAAAALLGALAITAFAGAMGWIPFPDLYRMLGVGWNQMEDNTPQYGVIQRQLGAMLRDWNHQRLEHGLDQGNVSRMMDALAAGDLTLEEIYRMYGKQPLAPELVAQVTDRYPQLPDLEREVREGEARMEELYPKYKDHTLDAEEQAWWDDYREKTDAMYRMQEEVSRELTVLQAQQDAPALWPDAIPQAYRMTEAAVPLIADLRLQTDAAYIQLLVEEYLPQILDFAGDITVITPAPETVELVCDRVWSHQREVLYPDGIHPQGFAAWRDDTPLTATREEVEAAMAKLFPLVRVRHGDPVDEQGAAEALYDADTGLYSHRFIGTDNPDAQWQGYPLSITREGDRRVLTAVVLQMVDRGDARVLLTPDGTEVHRFPSRQLIRLTRYDLAKLLDTLPKWEFAARVDADVYQNSRGDSFEYGLADYSLLSVRALGAAHVEDRFADEDGGSYRIDTVAVDTDAQGLPVPVLEPDSVFDGACAVTGGRVVQGAEDVRTFVRHVRDRTTATLTMRGEDFICVLATYPDRIQAEEYQGEPDERGLVYRWSREIAEAAITDEGAFVTDEWGDGWWLGDPPDWMTQAPPQWRYIRPLTGITFMADFDAGQPPAAGQVLLFLENAGLLAPYTSGSLLDIPAREFEDLAQSYFPADSAALRQSFLYHSDTDSYVYDWGLQASYGRMRGQQQEYGDDYVIPSVVQQGDLLYITVCHQYGVRRYQEVLVVVEPREDGGCRYVSREVVFSNYGS